MKLLLVEDDMEISQMLKSYLTTENYEVVCAADGEEACTKFDHDSYSLVLLDLMIPKISGMEVMQRPYQQVKKQDRGQSEDSKICSYRVGDWV